jgi:hypothetical protein
MWNFLRSLLSKKSPKGPRRARPAARPRPSLRPAMELLEGRQLLSASPLSTVTYQDSVGHRGIAAFETTSDGHLKVNYRDGTEWKWSDMGRPTATVSVVGAPAAITYLDGPHHDMPRVAVYARGSNGHLYVVPFQAGNTTPGWTDLGKPTGSGITGDPGAATYDNASGQHIVDIFARGSDGHLYLCYFNGSQWQWADQGRPDGGAVQGTPAVLAYRANGGSQQMTAYVRCSDGHLHADHLNGSTPHGGDLGEPNGAVPVGTPSAVTYYNGSESYNYVFVQGSNGHLYDVHNYGGSTPTWQDLGKPSVGDVAGAPSAVIYADGPSSARLYVFVRGSDGHLHDVTLSTQTNIPVWGNLGTPTGPGISGAPTITGDPSAVTYQDSSGSHYLQVFAEGSDGQLYRRQSMTSLVYNPFPWHNQGYPPVIAVMPPGNILQVARDFTHQDENFRNFIKGAYLKYLGRLPDQAGLDAWANAMETQGVTDERLEAGFIGSDEYIGLHGGKGAGWVRGMYHDLLGRTPSDAEVQGWVNALNSGVSPSTVAYGFAASAEREGQRVQSNYKTYLDRFASADEASGWVNAFTAGQITNEDMQAGFMASVEYYNRPSKGRGTNADWVASIYQDVLHRPGTPGEVSTWAAKLQ